MVCGFVLEYLENETLLECSYCHEKFSGFIKCPNGHHVCEACHNKTSLLLTREVCSASTSKCPAEIFENIIASPVVPMLGCHHALSAAGSFITAIKNEGTLNISDSMINEVFVRTERQAIGGYCGLTGVCGIAPALGACFAVILGSKCGMNKEQKITMNAVSEIVAAIAELTGPSCCKAYARKSLEVAQSFLEKKINIKLEAPGKRLQCNFPKKHPHGCRYEKCPYYK